MKKIALVLCLCLFAVGCAKQAQSEVRSTNEQFKVEKLFDVDGATVYRFFDSGRNHYFVLPKGQVIATQTEQQGKALVNKSENIPTVGKEK